MPKGTSEKKEEFFWWFFCVVGVWGCQQIQKKTPKNHFRDRKKANASPFGGFHNQKYIRGAKKHLKKGGQRRGDGVIPL